MLFDAISPRYDPVTSVLTFGQDRFWREAAIAALAPGRGERILDAGTGTGKLLEAVVAAGARGVGIDIAGLLMCRARGERIIGDALRLPFRDGSFDGIVNGFVLRNLESLDAFFREAHRVLMVGGRLVCLEIAEPEGSLAAPLHRLYFRRFVPIIGGALTGKYWAYSYLASSLERFPAPRAIAALMRNAGFASASIEPLSRGAAALIIGRK